MRRNISSFDELQQSSMLAGANSSYLEEMYEQYIQNPASIPEKWQRYFKDLPAVNGHAGPEIVHSIIKKEFKGLNRLHAAPALNTDIEHERKQVKVVQLIDNYRLLGHLCADVDPLKMRSTNLVPELSTEYIGFSNLDLEKKFATNGFHCPPNSTLREIISRLQRTYCGSIGMEYMHISAQDERSWLQDFFEKRCGMADLTESEKKKVLARITAAEGLEKYLGSKFPGAKRFSLEGSECLMVAIDELIFGAIPLGIKAMVIGMAHRGRLNVLVNNLGKSPEDLFDEFAGKNHSLEVESGDVKYHQGFSSDVVTEHGKLHIALAFNPSHLEIVSPVVSGSVRARQKIYKDKDRSLVIPVIVHGDAAFAGQGVVMESLNMSQTSGYKTGGTIHIIVNNQIGFTTSNAADARSTLYCTDIAKMVQAPIFHVNGDDPEAVVLATRAALAYRQKFKKDVVLDVTAYRRHGHNEADEPAATQPLMYQFIRQHPTVRKIYSDKLISEGVLQQSEIDKMADDYRNALDAGKCVAEKVVFGVKDEHAVDWTPYLKQGWRALGDTTFDINTFKEIAVKISTIPEWVKAHPRVQKIFEDRLKMSKGEILADWGFAENMAYATLLYQGYPVRLSGQDCQRGTFFHRHAVVHSQEDGTTYTPLDSIDNPKANFLVIDSLLSEEAVLGFEYGFSSTDPRNLVIWEAQFGDFANGAQVVIDQFISSGEQKWGRLCGLTMLLPHGYEGQGPEHSSARLERYLQSCAEHNIQVCVPSTPAQVYHMLRRQMLRPMRRPLIAMTPKSLLRHKLAVSTLDELINGQFQPVIYDIDELNTAEIKKVVLCSGKVYYDLLEERRQKDITHVALIRIEQLYPFPEEELRQLLQSAYSHVENVVWCQEEPQNQGAWYSSQHHMRACLTDKQRLSYVGRESSAAPAVGYYGLHLEQQSKLVKEALA